MPGSARYHAPPVSYPVGRCLWEAWVLLALCLLLLGAVLVAAVQGADPRAHGVAVRSVLLGLAGWAVVSVWAAWTWWHSPHGRLLWREGQWQWWPEGVVDALPVEAVHLALDAQRVLLLKLEGGRSVPRWLWLECHRDLARWDDLRRAVWAIRPMGYISRPLQ